MTAQTSRTIRRLVVACFIATLAGQAQATQITANFSLDYAVTQSLWQGGPTQGLDENDEFGLSAVGGYYDIKANLGTVESEVSGTLRTVHPDMGWAGSGVNLAFTFLAAANGGFLESKFGASGEAGIYLDVCIPVIVTCIDIDTKLPVIDEGFFLQPTKTFTPTLDMLQSASDADEAAGVKTFSFGPISLGPSMNLDLDQTISLTPTGLNGMLTCTNLDTGETQSQALSVPNNNPANVMTGPLSGGTWQCTIVDLALANSFRDDINLELRPAIDYIIGSWPPPGQGLFSFGLIDETFSLNFNKIQNVGSFQIEVIPEPASLALLGLAFAALALARRRSRSQAAA